MNLIRADRKMPIHTEDGAKYKGMASNGSHFYFTCPDSCKIVEYDASFCETGCFDTARPYTCICYDSRSECFWAASKDCYFRLFQLDCRFREIDSLTLRVDDVCSAIITGVSYDCQHNQLLVSFPNCVVSVGTSDCSYETVRQKSCAPWNMGVLSVSPSYMVIEMLRERQQIAVYNSADKLQFRLDIPREYFVEALLLKACAPCCDGSYQFYLLVSKNGCYSYLLEWSLRCSDLEIARCNFYCPPPCPKPPHPCSERACTDLMESIALVETALSHVLNAEGEKLQKAIACTTDVEQLLCVNDSVSETIARATHLEILLHDKLSTLQKCCCKREPPKKPRVTPC